MDIESYIQRIDISKKMEEWSVNMHKSCLVPLINTKIYNMHKWSFIPDFELNNFLNSKKQLDNYQFRFSNWWHFYKNSYILDSFLFCDYVWEEDFFYNFIKNYKEKINENIEDSKNEMFISILQWWIELLEKEIKKLYFLENIIYFNKYNKIIKERIEKAIFFIDFVINRENYLIQNSPKYEKERALEFVKNLEKMKKEYQKFMDCNIW